MANVQKGYLDSKFSNIAVVVAALTGVMSVGLPSDAMVVKHNVSAMNANNATNTNYFYQLNSDENYEETGFIRDNVYGMEEAGFGTFLENDSISLNLATEIHAALNRLRHTVNNLNNVNENVQAAESQIRDTDMASEMTSGSGLKGLNQASGMAISERMQSQIRGLSQASRNAQDGIDAIKRQGIILYNVNDAVDPYEVVPTYYTLNFNNKEFGEGENEASFAYLNPIDINLQLGADISARMNFVYGSDEDVLTVRYDEEGLRVDNDAEIIAEISGSFVHSAEINGGAVSNINGGVIEAIDNAVFLKTQAEKGGAVYNADSVINSIANSTFIGGQAGSGMISIRDMATSSGWAQAQSQQAGAIYNNNGTIGTIENNLFVGNNSYGMGGVIVNDNNAVIDLIDNTNFVGYSAVQGGGAIANLNGSTINTISNTVFLNEQNHKFNGMFANVLALNETSDGGAIANAANIGVIENVEFLSNVVTKNGGAIVNSSAGVINSIIDSNFNGNVASNNGGAISNMGRIDEIDGVNFVGNKSKYIVKGTSVSSVENTQAAESRIRDTDMASESTIRGTDMANDMASGGMTKGLNKLSSGMKINRAADDAALGVPGGGAIYNRWNATISVIRNSSFIGNKATYNNAALTAESQIRDTDMASEMVTYSKNNMLAQANQSMLADADSDMDSDTSTSTSGKVSSGMKVNRAADDAAGLAISERLRAEQASITHEAMSSRGGAIANNGTIGEITDSEFVKNSAEYGGAIYNSYENGTLGAIENRLKHTISNLDNYAESTIRDTDMGMSLNSSPSYNQRILLDVSNIHAEIGDITRTDFVANNAHNGGAIYNGAQAQVLNYAAAQSAVLSLLDGDSDLDNDMIKGSYNLSNSGIGLEIQNPEIEVSVGNITDSNFIENRAQNGGAIFNGIAAAEGFAPQAQSVLSLLDGDSDSDWDVSAEQDALVVNATVGDITNTLFQGNVANNGGAIFNQGRANVADGIYNNQDNGSRYNMRVKGLGQPNQVQGVLSLLDGDMDSDLDVANTNNNIDFDYDYKYVQDFSSRYAQDPNLSTDQYFNTVINAQIGEIVDSTFSENTAYNNGGAIYNVNAEIAGITNVQFTDNTAESNGGAIYNSGLIANGITDSVFTGNTAEGVLVNQGVLSLLDGDMDSDADSMIRDTDMASEMVTYSKNNMLAQANQSNQGVLSLLDGDMDNDADDMPIRTKGMVVQHNTQAMNAYAQLANVSNGDGGAIYNSGKIEVIESSTFENNTAADNGGAIYNAGEITNGINNTVFTGNIAEGSVGNNVLSLLDGDMDNDYDQGVLSLLDGDMDSDADSMIRDTDMANDMTSGGMTKGLNKLSSGYKINRAADDAAGMKVGNGGMEIRSGNGGAIYNVVKNTNSQAAESMIRDTDMASEMLMQSNQSVLSLLDGDSDADFDIVETPEENEQSAILTINNSTFTANTANANGGAIYNVIRNTNLQAAESMIRDTDMASEMVNYTKGGLSLLDGDMDNDADQPQGVLSLLDGDMDSDLDVAPVEPENTLTVNNSHFEDNVAHNNGGAISSVIGNNTQAAQSMLAQANQQSQGVLSLLDGDMDNDADDAAGLSISEKMRNQIRGLDQASEEPSQYTITIVNSSFVNNEAGGKGGAIYSNHNVDIIADGGEVIFQGNRANVQQDSAQNILAQAGQSMLAQANQQSQGVLSLLDGDMDNDYDSENVQAAESTIRDTDMADDMPSGGMTKGLNKLSGGTTKSTEKLSSGYHINRAEDTEPDDNAIYLDASNAKLTFDIRNAGHVYLYDNVRGQQGYEVEIKGQDASQDTMHLYNDIYNAKVSMGNVNLDTINNQVHTYQFDKLTLTDNINMAVDVDLANEQMDRLQANSYELGENVINVAGMNLLSDAVNNQTNILFADNQLKNNVTTTLTELGNGATSIYQTTAYAPIYKYTVTYQVQDDGGYFNFTKGVNPAPEASPIRDTEVDVEPIQGSEPEQVVEPEPIVVAPASAPVQAAPTRLEDFNPAVLTSTVVSQASVSAAQSIMTNNAFHSVDVTAGNAGKLSSKYANRLALADYIKDDLNTNNPLFEKPEQDAVWVKPFVTFENIPLANGPKIDSISYGTLIGYDSNPFYHKRGFESVWTGYVGYTGASTKAPGVDSNANGGLAGATYSLYKGNFFNATTVTAGASLNIANNMYGRDKTTTLFAGVGNKTGYNFSFKEGLFVFQPSLLLSYTFANTFNYTNSAGVRIESAPINAIQISPGAKFYVNTKNGWKPYIGVNMMWNILSQTRVKADGVNLPETHIKPYVQYGIGIEKSFKDNFTAYGQAMLQNGGRNGISLTAGFKWALGRHDSPQKVKSNTMKTVLKETPKKIVKK